MSASGDQKAEWNIINLNKKALDLQAAMMFPEALMVFRRLEGTLRAHQSVKLQLFSYNNIAVYYIKQKDLDSALDYLKLCVRLVPTDVSSYFFQIGVYLNICAIRSKQGQHKEALSYALKALQLLDQCPNDCLKVVAHYSVGLEYEKLSQYSISKDYFTSGLNFSLNIFGSTHGLTAILSQNLKKKAKKYNAVNEICILSDNFPNLRRKSCGRSPKKISEFEEYGNGIKIDTTPWNIGDDWGNRTSSNTPNGNSKVIRGRSVMKADVSKSFSYPIKVNEKLGRIGNNLNTIDKRIRVLQKIAQNKEGANMRKTEAAKVIQKAVRGFLKKRRDQAVDQIPFFIVQNLRKNNKIGALRSEPQRVLRKNYNKRSLVENIIYIQKHIRGYLARKFLPIQSKIILL